MRKVTVTVAYIGSDCPNRRLLIFGLALLFVIFFGYIALTDEFTGVFYGHNSVASWLAGYILIFLDEG